MLIVTGQAEVGLASIEDLKAHAAKMAAATRAEPGCRAYAFYQDIEDPSRFRVYEEWDGPDALAAHFQTPHMAAFNAALKALEIKSITAVKFEPGEMTAVI